MKKAISILALVAIFATAGISQARVERESAAAASEKDDSSVQVVSPYTGDIKVPDWFWSFLYYSLHIQVQAEKQATLEPNAKVKFGADL